jgi:branched-chain amino acid transport system substrate-binding protein
MNLIKLLGSAALAVLLVTTAQAQDTVKIGWALPKSGPGRAGAAITDAAELPGVGEGRERRRRAQCRRQEDEDRGDRVRRTLELRRADQGDRASRDAGQGRLHPGAVEHGDEPRGRADLQQIRLPASRRDGELEPLARDGEALGEPHLLARPCPSEIIDGLVTTLDTLRKDGKIGNKVAMAAVGDQFGIEQSTAAREAFKKANFELVYDKSYPFGTQDLQPIVKDAQAGNPTSSSHSAIRRTRWA